MLFFLLLMLLRSSCHQVSDQADKFVILGIIFLFSLRFALPYLYHRKHFAIKVLCRHKSSMILPRRDVTHYQALLARKLSALVRILRKAGFAAKV